MNGPPGVRIIEGMPLRCGLRSDDVIVDWLALGDLVYTYGRSAGDVKVKLDPVEWSLSWRSRKGAGSLPPGQIELAPGFTVERVDAPVLVGEPRFLHGQWVVGPRGISQMYEDVRVHWDIVDGGSHRRLLVEDKGTGAPPRVSEYTLAPRGLDLEIFGPEADRDDEGNTVLTPGVYGVVGAEVAKRLALELGFHESAWIGWDGVIRTMTQGGRGVQRSPLEMFARLHLNIELDEQRDRVSPSIREAFDRAEPASTELLAGIVRQLRPRWSQVCEQAAEELKILADALKGRTP